jgi:hypothetical protein
VHAARDDGKRYDATVLAAPGLPEADYMHMARQALETAGAGVEGRTMRVWVFDDPKAEKLAVCWTRTLDRTPEDQELFESHLMAGGTCGPGSPIDVHGRYRSPSGGQDGGQPR